MEPPRAELAIRPSRRPVKVAVVSPYGLDHYGGVQDQVLRLAAWLRDAGHQALVVAPAAGEHGVDVGGTVAIAANRSKAPLSLDPRAVRRAARAVAGADVVHLHEPFMPVIGPGLLWADTPPKVGTFHADPSDLVRRAYRWARPLLAPFADRLAVATAPSELAASAVAGLVEVRIVPNGIDVAGYRQAVDREPARVAFLGRDEPRKGLAVLLDAWPQVAAAVDGAELVVIGASGVDGAGVRYLGRVAEDEKRRALASSSVYCAPNLGGESFGIVVAEGMAAGCAVVASDIPAFARVLAGAGRTVPPGDAPALAATLVGVLGDDGERERLAAAARERVQAFDRATVLAGYLAAYEAAVAAA